MPVMCAANGDSCNHSVITGSGKKKTIQQPKGPLPEILNDQREEDQVCGVLVMLSVGLRERLLWLPILLPTVLIRIPSLKWENSELL